MAHLASVASLWAAFQGAFAAGVTTRGGARGATGEEGTSYDVDIIPGAGVTANEGRFNLALGYTPLFNMRDVSREDRATVVLHTGYLRLGYSEGPLSLSLSQSGSVGTMAFRGLRTASPDPQAIPNPTMSQAALVPFNDVVKVFNESTNATVGYRWDGQLSSGLGAGYAIGGGLGSTEQVSLPQFRTANADVSTNYALSGTDTLGGSLAGSNIRTHGGTTVDALGNRMLSPDYGYWTLAATLTWSHHYSRTTSSSLFGGAYGYSTTPVGRTTLYSLVLTGGGSFDAEVMRDGRLVISAGVGAGVAPAVNGLTSGIQQRVSGTGRVTAAMDEFSLNVSGDGSQTFPVGDPNAARLVGVGAGFGYAPAKFIDLSIDYRNTWQFAAKDSTRLWIAFLSLSVRAPPVRF